jgi:hypothetical protein
MAGRGTAVAIALLLGGAALVAAGCGFGAGKSVGSVDLTVTREFGAVKVSKASGDANESDTVMRFLEDENEIETRYGGGFVKSIDGISEGEHGGSPYDWFFYVNGVESPVGAAEVSLSGGEKIWWDYHDWSQTDHVPAVVGSFPAPFTTGWEGHAPVVQVECMRGGKPCETVAKALEAEGVTIEPPHEVLPKAALRVYVGRWPAVRRGPGVAPIEKGPAESGVYAKLAQAGAAWDLIGLDEDGGEAKNFGPGAGLVAATRHFEGPPIWVVTGGTDAGVRAAAEAFDAADLRDRYAVASAAGTVSPLPVRSGP